MGSHVPSLHASLPNCTVPMVDPTGQLTVLINLQHYVPQYGQLSFIYSWHIIQYCI